MSHVATRYGSSNCLRFARPAEALRARRYTATVQRLRSVRCVGLANLVGWSGGYDNLCQHACAVLKHIGF